MLREIDLPPWLTNNWLTIIGLIGFTYFILHELKNRFIKWKWNCGEAPYLKGSGWLFSRNWVFFLKAKRNGEMLEFIWNIFKEQGESFRITIGGMALFATADPENIKAVLATQFNDFALGFRNSHFKPLLGDGIFTLDGGGWKHSRSLLRPNFTKEKVAHVQSLEKHLGYLVRHIDVQKGKPFDIQNYFYRLTVDTSTEFLFGQSLYGLKDEFIGETPEFLYEGSELFYDSFNTSQSYLATRAWSMMLYPLVNSFEFNRCNKNVHKFAKYYVSKALAATPEEIEERSKDGYCFLYELVKETRDPKILQDQLLNIMIAGRDTTAGLLSFTFYELARNPRVWSKLKETIYEHFGSGDDARIEDISFESLKHCDYLKYVINEVLRLYPSVPINYRVATKTTTLPRGAGKNGNEPVFIEKGRVIGYVISATHRDPKYYGEDAEVFKPERWADKSLKPGWAYLPFNGGPRICLGQQFALTEASYIIVRLCQIFPNLNSADFSKHYPPKMSTHLTLSLTDGANITLSR